MPRLLLDPTRDTPAMAIGGSFDPTPDTPAMAIGGSLFVATAPYGKVWCHEHYWWVTIDHAGWGPKAIRCTFAIIILSILLELAVHFGSAPKEAKVKEADTEAEAGTEEAIELLDTSSPPTAPAADDQDPNATTWTICPAYVPNARLRATRFALGALLYAGILPAYIVRIIDARNQLFVPEECRKAISYEPPEWTTITVLNTIPFVIASFAILRALLDCVLMRWGTFLGNGFTSKRGAMAWPPCAPLFGVLVVVYLMLECVRVPAAIAMGRWEVSAWTAGFVEGFEGGRGGEVVGEEEMGLVENVDGGVDGECEGSEEPPSYREAVGRHGEGSGEGKEEV